MDLLNIPLQVLRLILQQTVLTLGLCDAIKLRLVCSTRPNFKSNDRGS